MKFHDIDIIFSKKVAEYINDGYIIHTKSMSGSQGEIGKVDLVKDNRLIRIYLDNETAFNFSDRSKFSGSMVILRVSEWKYSASEAMDRTVWMSELIHLETKIFYRLDSRNEWYVEDLEDAIKSQRIRYNRLYLSHVQSEETTVTTDVMKEIGAKYLKRVAGYKRVRKDEIRIERKSKCYWLHYAGKRYYIQ